MCSSDLTPITNVSEGDRVLYTVRVIADEALPEGTDWAVVEVDGHTLFLAKRCAFTGEGIADAWAAFRRLVKTCGHIEQHFPQARPWLQAASD